MKDREYVCDCCGAVGVSCVPLQERFQTHQIKKVCFDCERAADALLTRLREVQRLSEISEVTAALKRRNDRAKQKLLGGLTRRQHIVAALKHLWKGLAK